MKNMEFRTEVILSSEATAAKFQELRQNDKFCDVSLFSGNTVVKAHRVVLVACCSYFEAMFNAGLKESHEENINLPSISPDVLPLLVDFIYTGRVTISESTVQQLMAAAHLLQLQNLVTGCACYLKSQLDQSNALSILSFAETLSCSDVVERAEVYVGKHWATVTQNQDFLDLPLPMFVKVISSDRFVVKNELDVVVSVVRWLEHEPATRVPLWDKLFSLLCLSGLSTEVLDDVWKNVVKDTQLAKILRAFSMGMMARGDTRQRGHCAFYVVGGNTNSGIVSTVSRYDIHKKTWGSVAPMMAARRYLGVAVLDGQLYAVGGQSGGPLATGEVYDPIANEWSPIAAMNTARSNFGLAALGGKLYAFGGEGAGAAGALGSVEVYDPRTDTWTAAGDMPQGRSKMGVVVYEGVVYLTGGSSSAGVTTSVLRYEVAAGSGGQWHTCAPMSCARRSHAAVAFDGHLYVVGGLKENNVALNTVACYDSATDRWEDVAPMKDFRYDCMAGAAGNVLLVAGGWGTSSMGSVEVYEVGEDSWLTRPSMPVYCYGAGCAAM